MKADHFYALQALRGVFVCHEIELDVVKLSLLFFVFVCARSKLEVTSKYDMGPLWHPHFSNFYNMVLGGTTLGKKNINIFFSRVAFRCLLFQSLTH